MKENAKKTNASLYVCIFQIRFWKCTLYNDVSFLFRKAFHRTNRVSGVQKAGTPRTEGIYTRRSPCLLTVSERFLEWIRRVAKVVCLRESSMSAYVSVFHVTRHVASDQRGFHRHGQGARLAKSRQNMPADGYTCRWPCVLTVSDCFLEWIRDVVK